MLEERALEVELIRVENAERMKNDDRKKRELEKKEEGKKKTEGRIESRKKKELECFTLKLNVYERSRRSRLLVFNSNA